MKRAGIWLILLLIICSAACCALANSWGLTGPLLNYVMDNKDLENYSSIAEFYKKNCQTSAAVIRNRYHSVLLVYGTDADGNQSVWRSTTAVWQPDEMDEMQIDDKPPVITCTDDSVTLQPERSANYVFSWDQNENTFLLTRAEYGDFVLTLRDGVYYSDSGKIWQARPIDIQTFNIRLFPRNEYDMLAMNRVYAALDDASGFWNENVTDPNGKTVPVYSAPDTNSYRAAKGKAAVDTSENFRLLASVGDWDLVEYEVSYRTHRTGWINGTSLSEYATVMMTEVPALSVQYLTDDPFWSQYRTFGGSQLQNIRLLALANPFYAYASAETTDGETVWGFVPVQDCALPDEVIDESVLSDLRGTWVFCSGGDVAAEVMLLHSDGSCELGSLNNEMTVEQIDLTEGLQEKDYTVSSEGTWYVIDSLSKIGYEKTLIIKENGRATSLGLYLFPAENEDGRTAVTLCRGEAGGGYMKVADEEQPLQISPVELTYTDPEQDARTFGFGYDKLEERWKPFFPEEIWSGARFLVDPSWEESAAYHAEHDLGIYKHYPVVTVLDGNVQVHLFNVEGDSISRIAATSPDSGMKETGDNKVTAPVYWMYEAVGETDGIYRYEETLNLYFDSNGSDPRNTQIVLETDTPDDPGILHITAVVYQFNDPRNTMILGQKYDFEIIVPTGDGIEYGYGYLDEPLTDSLVLPLKGNTAFSEFTVSSFQADPEELLTEAKTETAKHGNGGKVNLRRQPGKNAKTVVTIPNNASVKMADIGNGWCFVRYQDDYGYVMSEYIEGTDSWKKD